jgi:hypothetical protein
MIKFVRTTVEDIPKLQSWISVDPWHSFKDAAEWWIYGYLTFKLVDPEGDVLFVRLDKDGESRVRLHTQFAPPDVVSTRRVAAAIVYGITAYIPHGIANSVTGIVTESVSPKLVAFLIGKMNFEPLTGNDYVLDFSKLKSSEGQ